MNEFSFTATWQGGELQNFNQFTRPGTHSACFEEALGDSSMAREGEKETDAEFTPIYADMREKQAMGTCFNHMDKRHRLIPGASYSH